MIHLNAEAPITKERCELGSILPDGEEFFGTIDESMEADEAFLKKYRNIE